MRPGSERAPPGARRRPRGRWRTCALLAALALPVVGNGCLAFGRTETGSVPAPGTIAALREGEALASVITSCGAPLETWRHPDGAVLVWRARRYDYDRIGIDPSRVLSFVPLPNAASQALSNVKLTFEWATALEDRLVAIFDRRDRLVAWAFRAGADEAPVGEGARK